MRLYANVDDVFGTKNFSLNHIFNGTYWIIKIDIAFKMNVCIYIVTCISD
jgi:hypothetical protein